MNPVTERVRVAFCVGNLARVGGTELNAVRTAARLDARRFEVFAISLQSDGPVRELFDSAGIEVYSLPISRLYGAEAVRQGWKMVRLLRERSVDVLHSHDKYSNMFAVPWARIAGTKVVASRRWWHGEARRGHRLANRLSYHFAHAVLANAPRVGLMLQETEGVIPTKIAVVPNFVDAEAFSPLSREQEREQRWRLGLREGRFTIGSIANLRAVKDHATLLGAVALLRPNWPDLQVVLIGDGETRDALGAQARELGIESSVIFAGYRPHLPNLNYLFDVSVLTSLSEGFPNAVLEAMAAARPVVATDVGATADAVEDGVSGFLVPRANPGRVASALERLLRAPERAVTMGIAGRERVRREFTAEVALPALQSLYLRLVRPGAVPDLRTPAPTQS